MRGGKRQGAGRPLRNTHRLELGVDDAELEILDDYVRRLGLKTRAEAFRRAIRVHMASKRAR